LDLAVKLVNCLEAVSKAAAAAELAAAKAGVQPEPELGACLAGGVGQSGRLRAAKLSVLTCK
jgi:hypothetical protein